MGTGEDHYGMSCKAILDGGYSTGNGIYWIDPDGQGAFQTFCDMTVDGGGWTLMMSVVDDDRQLGADDSGNMWQFSGQNRWADQSVFGELATCTTARTGDYKNRAYFALSGSDLLMTHTPNGTSIDNIQAAAHYIYHTSDNFLDSKGGSLYNLFRDHHPMTNGGTSHGFHVDTTYIIGTANGLHSEQNGNNRGESTPGGITFAPRNNEGYPMAMCPVKYNNGFNSEHACVGGNGTTGGRGRGGWGNLHEWIYDSGWGMSVKMRTSTWLMFVR